MNALDATERVLRKHGRPLHYNDITLQIISQNLWHTEGKTPEATVRASIGQDIKKNGDESRFQHTGPGMYGLRSWGEAEPKNADSRRGEPSTEPIAKAQPPKMSFTSAAEYVLENHSARQPMHYRDVTAKALELGLVRTEGQTPAATLYAQVLTEIKRQTRRGDTPRFVKYGKGYIGLRKWLGTGLAFQIGRHNQEVRKKLLRRLHEMTAVEFEALVTQLLVALGFEDVEMTSHRKDGGIDVRGTLVVGDVIGTRMAVQAKKWKANVSAPLVQQVRGSLGAHEQGLIITTSDYSKGARVEAERADAVPVALMNGEQLVDLLIENDIAVQRTPYDLIELEELE